MEAVYILVIVIAEACRQVIPASCLGALGCLVGNSFRMQGRKIRQKLGNSSGPQSRIVLCCRGNVRFQESLVPVNISSNLVDCKRSAKYFVKCPRERTGTLRECLENCLAPSGLNLVSPEYGKAGTAIFRRRKPMRNIVKSCHRVQREVHIPWD